MTESARRAAGRRPWAVLATVASLVLVHRLTALLATLDLRPLVHGYSDAELLAPGGDLGLELVLIHQSPLRAALGTLGLWLVVGRLPSFLAVFFLYRTTFSWTWPAAVRARPGSVRPLHAALTLPVVLGASAASFALLGVLLFCLWRLRRWTAEVELEHAGVVLGLAAVVALVAWAAAEVWLDLHRLAVAGARLRPGEAARAAGQAWRHGAGLLVALRAGLAVLGATLPLAGALLLPVMTRGTRFDQVAATLTLELGLLGAACLRAAWLAWASAHLPPAAPSAAADLSRENSAAALPSAAPDAQDDPSRDPGA